jgi:hypothetical protein
LQVIATSKTAPVNIVVLGDSQSVCDQQLCATGPANGKRWPDLLRDDLQALYGSHGTGLIPLVFSAAGYPLNSETWNVAGTWEEDGSTGPQQGSGSPGKGLVRLEDRTTATFSPQLAFDHVNTYCASDPSTGLLSLQIDGAAAGTACSQPTATVLAQVATSTPVPAGAHTVTFTCRGSCLLYGAEATLGNTGVSVHNLAVSSAAAECFGQNPTTQLVFLGLIPGGVQLVVTDLLTNDPGLGYPVATYTQSMQNILAGDQALQAQTLFVVPPVNGTTSPAVFASYTDSLIDLARTRSVPLVDVQTSWGPTFNAQSGYWSTDKVHPNTAGVAAEYALIAPAIHLQ